MSKPTAHAPKPSQSTSSSSKKPVIAAATSTTAATTTTTTSATTKEPRRYVAVHATEMNNEAQYVNIGDSLSDICARPVISLATVGDPGVGKTTLLIRFAQRRFESRRVETPGIDYMTHWIKSRHPVYDRITQVTMFDTAGQERYKAFSKSYVRESGAVMLIFDASSRASFDRCVEWRQLIRESNEWCQVMLIANKMDVYDERDERTQQYKCKRWLAVPGMSAEERAQILVDDNNVDLAAAAVKLNCNAGAYAVSAQTARNLDEAFIDLVDQTIDAQQALANQHKSLEMGRAQVRQKSRGIDLRGGGGGNGGGGERSNTAADVQVTNKISCCAVK